jgi:hypothetical protein
MERSIGEGAVTPEEREQGARQVRHVLGTLRTLAANLERWAAWFEEEPAP